MPLITGPISRSKSTGAAIITWSVHSHKNAPITKQRIHRCTFTSEVASISKVFSSRVFVGDLGPSKLRGNVFAREIGLKNKLWIDINDFIQEEMGTVG
jgi:hypothetical protein